MSEMKVGYQKPKRQWIAKFMHNPKAMLGIVLILLLALSSVFLPVILHLDPNTTDATAGFYAAPTKAHLLGTDDVARDLFARVLHGGRVSLFVGIASACISILIGIPLGLLAGYFRGWWETVVLRLIDIFMSFPGMVLSLVIVAVFGPSIATVTVVMGVLGWTSIAKLIYGNTLSQREKEYIEASRAIGETDAAIIFHEILPNAIAPVWAEIAFKVSGAVLTESSLSFLGMGVQAPQASWGNIIYQAQNIAVLTGRPWVWIPPGICIVIVVIGFNFIGEGLRDALDPKTVREK